MQQKERAKNYRPLEIALEHLRRFCKTLQNEPVFSKYSFDTAENELSEVEILTLRF